MASTVLGYRNLEKAYLELKSHRISKLSKNLSVVIGGNCNTDFSERSLKYFLLKEGFDAKIESLRMDTWIGHALEDKPKADAWVIWLSTAGFTNGETKFTEIDINPITQAISALISRGKAVITILPEAGVAENDPVSIHRAWRLKTINDLYQALPGVTTLLSVESIQFELGRSRWQSSKYWTLAKCPCHPDATVDVSREVSIALSRTLSPRVKAIAVDLDNTIWGGIVGEDGPENLKLDPHAEGRPYLEMQRFLKDVKNHGIPICVVSKNEPKQAIRPFEERSEMILKQEDFVMFEASWDSKVLSLQKISNTLNIGIESICFLDDTHYERAEVRALLPDLIVPEMPEDPELRVQSLVASRLFTLPRLSEEDQIRTKSYLQDKQRMSDKAVFNSRSDFLKSLNMKLSIKRITEATVVRCVSLAHKTNQFNLTYRRSSAIDITAISSALDQYAYCFRLSDKYGDSGLIAVLTAQKGEGERLFIEEWLMSCRVFSRGVEYAIAEHLASWCNNHGIREIIAPRSVRARNSIVVDTLTAIGFSICGDNQEIQTYRTDRLHPASHFITLENEE